MMTMIGCGPPPLMERPADIETGEVLGCADTDCAEWTQLGHYEITSWNDDDLT